MIVPRCPNCRRVVPFLKTQLGLGQPFVCRGCQSCLKISRLNGLLLGLPLFTVVWLFKEEFPGGVVALFGTVVVIGLPVTWLLTRVSLVDRLGDSGA